ncbi:putative SEC14-like protein 6 [Orchesella cincta]|uniref:Putative SEC14-like protein 6 n=1 Tax=Orchesella cincta TaxID=48709 RepID=A0A1D2N329_ORCCI|nr:putative SEC14-like protein 6 [Orchesella cincta]
MEPLLTEDYMKTDFYLIRWLMANDFDMSAAVNMLAKNLRWRRENKMSSIHLENFDDMKRDFPTSVDTNDRDGRPVGTLDVSQWNIRNAIVTGRSQRLLRYICMLLENITNQVLVKNKNGANVTQWDVVMNADGMNMINHGCPSCIQVWMRFMYSLQNYYPGWMHEFIVIDAPFAVNLILDATRPAVSRDIRENMKVFGTNRIQWMQYLDSKISRKERTEAFGGTKSTEMKKL